MLEDHPYHFGEKELESRVMRKYPAWFGKRVTKKDHEFFFWYLVGTLLHSERAWERQRSLATRRGNGGNAISLTRPFLWDAGSGKTILQDIRKEIRLYTPSYPAICGFGMAIVQPNVNAWDPRIAQNYSNAGCDMVGIYSYVSTYPTPSDGSQFDFTMQTMLAAAFKSLRQLGWDRSKRSLLGIGQAFAGPYETGYKP